MFKYYSAVLLIFGSFIVGLLWTNVIEILRSDDKIAYVLDAVSLVGSDNITNNATNSQSIANELKDDTSFCGFGHIFSNYTLYQSKIQAYIDASDRIYPNSWQDLNKQLFCPIKYSSSLSLNVRSTTQEAIVKDIFQMQFFNNDKSECFNPNRKCVLFYILMNENI